MTDDLDIDEWDMYDALAQVTDTSSLGVIRSKKVELPKDVIRWTEIVGEFSLYNDYSAKMAYFVSMGQILKDVIRVPIGRLALDPRIHYCWIQTSRSGKTTMFDFLSPVWEATFKLVNQHPVRNQELPLKGVKEFTLNNPDSFTDQSLLGTMKMDVPNPDYNKEDADGDADSIMLLMDSLLNFSRQFLSDRIGGLMDAPLLVQPLVLPHESQPQAHNLEVTKILPLEFFESTIQQSKASDVTSVEIIKSRLETKRQFYDYHFTHSTSSLTTSKSRSAYSTLGSMLDKFDMQVRNAELIDVVNPSELVSNVISTHLIPDIMGNLRAYARQSFRCTACGKSYRRMPLIQTCVCGHKLIATITRGSVEKYLKLAKRLVEKYDVGEYQRGRIHALSDEIELVFGKSQGDQSLLTDYA